MQTNKNLFIAIALSVGFMLFWSTVVMPRFTPKPPAVPPPPAAGTVSVTPTLTAAHAKPVTPLPDSILRNRENEIVFTSQGAGVSHWALKLKNQEIDLVLSSTTGSLPLTTFPEAIFKAKQQDNQIHLKAAVGKDLALTKTLTLSATDYLHNLTFRFENASSQPMELKGWEWAWGPGLGTTHSELKENKGLIRALSKNPFKIHVSVLKPGEYGDLGEWAAIDNRYYLVAIWPESGIKPSLKVTGKEDHTTLYIRQDVQIPANGSTTLNYKLYVGPKGYTHLHRYNKDLETTVDFGWFSWLGKKILSVTYWLQEKTGNWGWAIILLTILMQIALLPLTLKSYKSMMLMKDVQPQMAALQKAYKSDPKRLQIETMNLYKKAGTNPLSGCLPMMLQMPIFVALFNALRNAYELRGAPFMGWLQDLSAADPYYILPLLNGGAVFLQQRVSGTVTDPMQRQMMYIMPVMLTVMFINFPSGLVLYWVTQAIIGALIQWTMYRVHTKNKRTPKFELVK